MGKYPTRSRILPRIRWTSNEYAYFECSLNGAEYSRCGNGLQGSYSRSEIPSGAHVFRVRGRDNKGNVGEPISLTIEIGTERVFECSRVETLKAIFKIYTMKIGRKQFP